MLAQTQQQLNAEIEGLKTLRARVEEIDRSIEESRTSLHEALRLEDEASMHEGEPPHELAELVGLSREDQYQLADSLEDFERRRAKLEWALVSLGRDSSTESFSSGISTSIAIFRSANRQRGKAGAFLPACEKRS